MSEQDQEKHLLPNTGMKICLHCLCDFTCGGLTSGERWFLTSPESKLHFMVRTHKAASESTESSRTQKVQCTVTILPYFVSASNSILGGREKEVFSTITSLLSPCGGNYNVTLMRH